MKEKKIAREERNDSNPDDYCIVCYNDMRS